MATRPPIFDKLLSISLPLLVGGLLAAGAMNQDLSSLRTQTDANTQAIGVLQTDYGRVDERLKSIKETVDRILIAVEK